MKKLLMLTIAALLVMVSLPSLAKVVISDEDLNKVTAEEGVSVQFVNMTVGGTSIDELSWGDGNGFGSTYTSAGFVGAKNVVITGDLTVISGTANIDVGSSGSQTRVALSLPTVTLGTMNVDTVHEVERQSGFIRRKGTGNSRSERIFFQRDRNGRSFCP